MQRQSDYSDHDIESLVRLRLEEHARDIDTSRLLERIEASVARGAGELSSTDGAGASRPWLRRVAWAAAAAVLLIAVGSVLRLMPETVQAASVVRESLEVHRLPVDRCYLVDRRFQDGETPEPTVARVDRLWTRGDRFYWESSTDRYRWAWGRDEQGTVWLTYGKRHGIKLEASELPPWLASYCEVLSLDMETLLDEILRGCQLTGKASDSPQTVVIHAAGQPQQPHRWLKEATLEIDRVTHVIRRATVTRLIKTGRMVTITFTLVSNEVQPADKYQLEGHLAEPFEVFTSDHKPQQRQKILTRLFGPRAFSTLIRDRTE